MKKVVLLFIVMFLLTVIAFGQNNSINYKAIIKDGSGNVVANTAITVQFQILEDVTNVYQETHSPTTNANGLVILNIGEGTTGDVFADIDWGSDDHFLNVQIDTSGGTTYTDMGTTQFAAVPYALNVTGLEEITEGGRTGWRLKGRNPLNYVLIGSDAVDLSYSPTFSSTFGASGVHSLASGLSTSATGNNSFATGSHTKSGAVSSSAFGRYNIGGGNYFQYIQTDPLFEVGNGTGDANRTNALTILKNGTITAPTFDLAEITDAKALITKEYADTNFDTSSGLETLDEGNGFGWRLIGQDPASYGNIGFEATDLSYSNSASTTKGATGSYSTAMGFRTISSGTGSTAMGYVTEATGNYSTAMGSATEATGSYSTAMGFVSRATGYSSTAMGRNTDAIGESSTVMGFSTDADSYASLAMGRYNVGGGDATTWVETDPLLEVGNGASSGSRTNALTILKNGTITAPSFDLAEITDAKALITKEYADANLISSGLEKITEGGNTGWRLIGQDPANYGNIGNGAVDLSYSYFATNLGGAKGDNSTAMGIDTQANGDNSTAMGSYTKAIGGSSTSLGINTEAIGDFSIAMGINTKSESYGSVAFGIYNIGGGSAVGVSQTDPLFEVGNGSSPSNKSNALTILKNGKVGIGTATPDTQLAVAGIISAAFDTTEADKIEIAHGGSNAYINVIGTGNLAFRHEGSTGMTFTDTDRLGIGTATPDEKLSVAGVLNLKEDIATVGAALKVNGDQALWYDGTRFSWGFGGTSNTFANNVGFGMTSVPSYRIDVRDNQDTDYISQIFNTSTNTDANGLKIRLNASNPGPGNFFVGFFDGSNTTRGKITGDGAGTLYQTTSDRRLKTNIVDIQNSLELINKIQPRKYEFKLKLGKEEYGFVAQELQPLYPQAVSGSPDSDVTKDPMMVDYSRLTPLLTAGIKELDEKFNVFEKENKRLKNENEELKAQLSKYEALEERLTVLENKKITNSILTAEK